nr:MAG TPA: hypothetical protein [Caudoviricetes sp.]
MPNKNGRRPTAVYKTESSRKRRIAPSCTDGAKKPA